MSAAKKTAAPEKNSKAGKIAALKRFEELLAGRSRPPTLRTLGAFVAREFPALKVEFEKGYCNTDRKPAGFRYITHPGKGRTGTRIKIYDDKGVKILDHNAAETYRSNGEVVRWIYERLGRSPFDAIQSSQRFYTWGFRP